MRISAWSSDVCSSDLDAHLPGLAAPGDRVHRLDDVLARLLLVVGRDRILEVEEHHVGRGFGSLLEEFRVAARHRQLAAVQARRCRLDDGKAHGCPLLWCEKASVSAGLTGCLRPAASVAEIGPTNSSFQPNNGGPTPLAPRRRPPASAR